MSDSNMLLTIDAGNTRTKWGVFVDGKLTAHGAFSNSELSQLPANLPSAWSDCQKAMVSNVAGVDVDEMLKSVFTVAGISATFIKSTASACRVCNEYQPPEALGTDRWAALIAAWSLYQQPCVVVNAGTALTVDALASHPSGQGQFLGGLILPGLWLMQDALVNNTAGIAQRIGVLQDFPTSTANAVHNGALSAMTGAVASMLAKLQMHQPGPLHCIMSGGDSALLAQALRLGLDEKVELSIVEHLVLQGLQVMAKDGMQKGGTA